MIKNLTLDIDLIKKINLLTKDKKLRTQHLLDIPFFKSSNSMEFKSGINVIFDRNATGKSVIMKMLASATACLQTGSSLYTKKTVNLLEKNLLIDLTKSEAESIGLNSKFWYSTELFPFSFVSHDGSKNFYCDPKETIGFSSFGSIDYDQSHRSRTMEHSEKSSTGLKNLVRTSEIFNFLKNKDSFDLNISHSHYSGMKDIFEELKNSISNEICIPILKGNMEKTNINTILLDEPEYALDIINTFELFNVLKQNQYRDDIQIIMITHSPFVFLLDNVNYITSDLDYLNKSKELVKQLNLVI